MTAGFDQSLDELIHRIVSLAQPLRIVLFGSAARGNVGADSDIDLLVIVKAGTHRRRLAQTIYREVTGLGVSFDLLVATPEDLARHANNPGLIYRTILAEGKEVYAA